MWRSAARARSWRWTSSKRAVVVLRRHAHNCRPQFALQNRHCSWPPLISLSPRLHWKVSGHEPLLFVGHYWRRGKPAPIRPNLACLDYSAVLNGKLVAYRLDQEQRLDPHKFVWVEVQP